MSKPERERRLVSIRRSVAPDRRDEYDMAWRLLHAAATARGAHAWRFRAASTPDLFLEFLEFGAEADLREDPAALAAIMALHESFGDPYPAPRTLEEWIEIPTPDPETP